MNTHGHSGDRPQDIDNLASAIHEVINEPNMNCSGQCIFQARAILMGLNKRGWFLVTREDVDNSLNRKIMLDRINQREMAYAVSLKQHATPRIYIYC